MARFVLITNGITSTTHTGLELARRLIAAGHEATMLCHADLADVAARSDVPFVRLVADRDAFERVRTTLVSVSRLPRRSAVRSLVELPGIVWRARRDTATAIELHEVIERIDPDVVVADTEAHVAIAALSSSEIPLVLSTFLFDVEPEGGAPPLDSRLLPGAGEIAATWAANLAEGRRLRRRRWLTRRGLIDLVGPISYASNGMPALRAVARRHRYRLRRIARTDGWLRPVWYPRLPTLSTNLPELEFGSGPAGWTYVGPMVAADDGGARWHRAADSDRWRELLAARERLDKPPALVYCSFGTYRSADRDLVGRVIEAVSGRHDLQLVIGLGSTLESTAFGEPPANVLMLDWADQTAVLRHADAAIVHGGNATLNECVVSGVPMVACSTGFLDQNGVCARIEHARIGRRVDRSASSVEIGQAIDDVLGDAVLRSRIHELCAVANDPARRRIAVDVLEELAEADR